MNLPRATCLISGSMMMTAEASNSSITTAIVATTAAAAAGATTTTTMAPVVQPSISFSRATSKRNSRRRSTSFRRSSLSSSVSSKRNNKIRPLLLPQDSDKNTEEAQQTEQMLSFLSEEELELAARSNYEYLVVVQGATATAGKDKEEEDGSNTSTTTGRVDGGDSWRRDCAKDMARRYLRSNKNRDPLVAVQKMRASLQFRREIDVDGLRLAFTNPQSPYRESLLHHHLTNKVAYVQGYDKEGRSTYVFEPHRVTGHDEEWTIKQHVFNLERAIACSKAKDKTVNAMVNFNGFSATRHAPPTHIGQQFLTTLRSHYAGHVHQIFLVDAPLAFYCLWTVFKPFVGTKTKSKIHFVSSDAQKQQVIGKYYSKDQATSWMLPGGQKNRELNVPEYLLETPFDCAFDM